VRLARWIMMLFCITVFLRAVFFVLYKIHLGRSIDGWDIALLLMGGMAAWIAWVSFKNLRRKTSQLPK
jgi:uncharacterized RDD family membrane protein YckC